MKTKITLFGIAFYLFSVGMSAQICPPRISFNWASAQYNDGGRRYYNTDYRYRDNRRDDRRYDGRSNGNGYNNYGNRNGDQSFLAYTLDEREVRYSFNNALERGARLGNLTNRELDRLNRKYDQIRDEFRCALDDGRVSSKDRRRIFDEISEMDERIHREWFDNDYR